MCCEHVEMRGVAVTEDSGQGVLLLGHFAHDVNFLHGDPHARVHRDVLAAPICRLDR